MKRILRLLLLAGLLPAWGNASPEGTKEDLYRAIAREFYEALYSTDNEAAAEFLANGYVEHQITARYSASGLLRYARARVAGHPGHYNVVHRTLAQGDLVFMHIEERLTPTESVARGELFRLSNDGKIVEHWGAEQPAIELQNNHNGFFLGSEVNRASKAGRKYAQRIMNSDAELFRNLDVDLIFKTRTNRYIQHNQWAANGPAGLQGFIESMKAGGNTVQVTVKHVVAEGDYIVGLNHFKTTPPVEGFADVIVFDLIRVTEDGKSDEHWDVIQELNGEPLEQAF